MDSSNTYTSTRMSESEYTILSASESAMIAVFFLKSSMFPNGKIDVIRVKRKDYE